MTEPAFIEKHGLWTDEQKARAEEIKRRLAADDMAENGPVSRR